VALMRGPLLYCIEQADQPDLELRDVVVPDDAEIEAIAGSGELDGMTLLRVPVEMVPPDQGWSGRLYALALMHPLWTTGQGHAVVALPYYAWANRDPGAMVVWMRAG
jgi:DUF1680 family protein